MPGLSSEGTPEQLGTFKKTKFLHFDSMAGRFRFKGGFITASEAERLANEELYEITQKSEQVIQQVSTRFLVAKMNEKMNKKNLELDTILDRAEAWAGWTTALFNALHVHDIPGTDYT